MKCELNYKDKVELVRLLDDVCQANDFTGLQSVSVIYQALGKELKTPKWSIQKIEVANIQATKLLVLPLIIEQEAFLQTNDDLNGLCDEFYLAYEGKEIQTRSICTDKTATMYFNLTDSFYMNGESERTAVFQVKNHKALIQGHPDF